MSYHFTDGSFWMVTSPDSLHGRLMARRGRGTMTVQFEAGDGRRVYQWYVIATARAPRCPRLAAWPARGNLDEGSFVPWSLYARIVDLDPRIRRRAEAMLGGPILRWRPRDAGLTHAVTGIATLAAGGTMFLKAATDEYSAREVGADLQALLTIAAGFMPELLGQDASHPPMLALEDLSRGHWPEPYPDDLFRLEAALAQLRSLPVPDGLTLEPLDRPRPEGWTDIAAAARSGAPAVAAWVAKHEAALLAAATGVRSTRCLVHGDLWYSNICFLEDRVVLVDWSHVRVGSPWHDAATVSIDLIIEGRPPLPMEEAAAWASYWLAQSVYVLAGGPPPSISEPSRWRTDVEELLDGAAWWVADELGLPYPPPVSDRHVGWR